MRHTSAVEQKTGISTGLDQSKSLDTQGPSIELMRDEIQRQGRTLPASSDIAMNLSNEGGAINLRGRTTITKEEAISSLPTEPGRRLAAALLNRPGVGNDYTYTKGEDGRCLEKVNDAMNSIGMPIERKAWAIQSVAALRASKNYIEVQGPISEADLDKFPIGTVYVAEKGGMGQTAPGHIAVRVQDKGKHDWCSDFRHSAVVYSGGYDKIWVFIPKGSAEELQTKAAGGGANTSLHPVTPAPATAERPGSAVPAATSSVSIQSAPELRVEAARQYESIRSNRTPMPKYGESAPVVELIKENLNHLRQQSPTLRNMIPPQTPGGAYDPEVMTAFTNLRHAVGYSQPNPAAQEVFGALDLNIVNSLMTRHPSPGKLFMADPAVMNAVTVRGL